MPDEESRHLEHTIPAGTVEPMKRIFVKQDSCLNLFGQEAKVLSCSLLMYLHAVPPAACQYECYESATSGCPSFAFRP